MKIEKRQLRIGELAQELGVEKFVIRFWEKEFGIKAPRTEGQQRLYPEKDIAAFQEIKSLLYQQGFTIAGAKKQLALNRSTTTIMPSEKTTIEETKPAPATEQQPANIPCPKLTEQMVQIQKQLLKLRELLQQ